MEMPRPFGSMLDPAPARSCVEVFIVLPQPSGSMQLPFPARTFVVVFIAASVKGRFPWPVQPRSAASAVRVDGHAAAVRIDGGPGARAEMGRGGHRALSRAGR
jgi:hypothetical protein